jgi:hypothetical protein
MQFAKTAEHAHMDQLRPKFISIKNMPRDEHIGTTAHTFKNFLLCRDSYFIKHVKMGDYNTKVRHKTNKSFCKWERLLFGNLTSNYNLFIMCSIKLDYKTNCE